MIQPTIGRVVLVRNRPGGGDQDEPALISYVFNPRCISVGGFDRYGMPFRGFRLPLAQDDDVLEGEHAVWMPYQKAQAAKDQLEAALHDAEGR